MKYNCGYNGKGAMVVLKSVRPKKENDCINRNFGQISVGLDTEMNLLFQFHLYSALILAM